jgi:hypothetical protein
MIRNIEWFGCKCGATIPEEHVGLVETGRFGDHVFQSKIYQVDIDKLPNHLASAYTRGIVAVDRLVRGTALLEPGEEANSWVARNLAELFKIFNAKEDKTGVELAAFAGFSDAADEAIKDLAAYKNRLYGR